MAVGCTAGCSKKQLTPRTMRGISRGFAVVAAQSGKQLRRRNHFVPASYLAPFTDNGSRSGALWVYSREEPRNLRHLHLTDVGLEKNLYIRELSSGPDDSVERFFADSIEGPFAAVRDRLLHGPAVGINVPLNQLGQPDRTAIARFAGSQLLRSPTERDAARWLAELSSRNFIQEQLEPGTEARRELEAIVGGPLKRRQRRTLQRKLPKLSAIEAGIKDWLPRTIRNAERFAPLIASLEWRLVEVPSSVALVTCDMPLVCVRRGGAPGSYRLGGAVAEPDFEATLTLSPSHVFYLTHEVRDDGFFRTEAFARSVRDRTIAYAQRWVYAKTEEETIAQALESTDTPSYYVDVAGQIFQVGDPIEDIERAIRQAGVNTIQFRYGVPK